jgi:endoglucanase
MAIGAAMDVKPRGKVVAVLTRAEEVGLVGCLALLKAHKFSKDNICVSLEASKELPGAKLGEGPVLRLGDRATIFDNLSSQMMWMIAQECQKKSGLKYQRRIMDGGRCEASAMSLYGLRTTGLAVPLRNYHNQGKKGPAPEIIDINDLKSGREILTEMGRQLSRFKNLESQMKKSIDTAFHALAPHLNKREWS